MTQELIHDLFLDLFNLCDGGGYLDKYLFDDWYFYYLLFDGDLGLFHGDVLGFDNKFFNLKDDLFDFSGLDGFGYYGLDECLYFNWLLYNSMISFDELRLPLYLYRYLSFLDN